MMQKRVSNQMLELLANAIENVFMSHRVAARVRGVTVTTRWLRFEVLVAVGERVSKVERLDREIAVALQVAECRIYQDQGGLVIEVPRDEAQTLAMLPLYEQSYANTELDSGIALLGQQDNGAPLQARLPSPDVAHIMVAGMTGSGKTVLLQSIILSLAMSNSPRALRFVLIDPKNHAFGVFDTMPHLVRPTIVYPGEAAEALTSLCRLMERRPTAELPRVVLVIDEMADLLMTGGSDVEDPLTRLLQRGRGSGIHVVGATQKPTANVIGTLIKANFPVRLCGKVASANDARVATGWSGTGAEKLQGRGDFIAVAAGEVIHFQAPYISMKQIKEIVAQMSGQQSPVQSKPKRKKTPVEVIKPALARARGWV